MKNLLLLSFLLIFQVSFSQDEKKDISNIKTTFFESNIEENHFFINKKPVNVFPKIIKLELKDIKNNSEGKFTLNTNSKKYFKQAITEPTSKVNIEKNISKIEKPNNIATAVKKELVNKIIIKKMEEEMLKFISMNEVITFGDRNLESYKNYNDLKNKLILSYSINSEIEVQVGKDIHPYLNKILKTELDKTLQNSLNLLAINF